MFCPVTTSCREKITASGIQIKQRHYLKICYIYFEITPCPHFLFQSLQNPFISVLFHIIAQIALWSWVLAIVAMWHMSKEIQTIPGSENVITLLPRAQAENLQVLSFPSYSYLTSSQLFCTKLLYTCLLFSIPIAIGLDFVLPSA